MTQALPRSWTLASLNSLGTWLGGGTPSKSNPAYWQNGSVHWVSPKDMKRLLIDSAQDQITKKAVKESVTNLVPANSVLMVTRSGILAHTFPVGINTVDVAINQDLKAWTSLGAVAPTYAAYFLRARGHHILRECSKDGTTVSSIDFDRLSAYPVAVAPANEQQRIVSKIDELFSRIEEGEQALKRVEKLVERYRQSVLKAAVTGELTRDWRETRQRAGEPVESGEALLARILKARRAAWEAAELAKLKAKGKAPTDERWKQKYTEPQPPDTTGLPELPEGWAWTSLPMLCSDDTCNGISVKGSDAPPGTPALRLDAMTENGFDYSARRYIKIEEGKAQRLAIVEGDFFVSRANGSRALVGRAVSAQPLSERIVFPDTMIRYRPLRDLVSESWLVATWASTFVRNQIERRAKTTAGIYKVSQEDIAGVAIPVCSPTEQREVVTRAREAIESITRVSITCAAERERSPVLRQSILKSAFSGQLVPQDPNDEPASKLLERIAASVPKPRPLSANSRRKSHDR